jgi:hypothetical protein
MKPSPTAPFHLLPKHIRRRALRALIWLMRQGGETREAAQRRYTALRAS